ncbi:hypothetical protein DM02DRAFT_163749 [Periconia macrospinosa]|uniref:Prion-inhibition and propagation HeLo domain-containing protein n=1 Tax=Periconia macrospinosa TaxID=97972 RepID=A0A2V1DB65_9PLEO|nr:hypothetical protein DM02DRAFT_163749 [Periconia macrospinosa]
MWGKKSSQLDEIVAESHQLLGCIGAELNQLAFGLRHFVKFEGLVVANIDGNLRTVDNRLANEMGNGYMINSMWKEGEDCFKKSLDVTRQLHSLL